MTDAELDALRRDVQYLKDRSEILDCVNNQSRGHDRHDLSLMRAVYHADGFDEHGPVVKSGEDYGAYANEAHTGSFEDHLHHLTTHTCEIDPDGTSAHAESYVIGTMRPKGAPIIAVMGGRYLDRLEKRDGTWRIAVRRCTIEFAFTGDASMMQSGAFKGFLKGKWDESDLSYTRPLGLDSEPAERW